jgi:hypothetical protein
MILIQTKPTKSILEFHHVMGWEIDENGLVVLCLNCHRLATLSQHDVGFFTEPRTGLPIEQIPPALRSLATFLNLLVQSLCWMADVIEAFIKTLNVQSPNWRTSPGFA